MRRLPPVRRLVGNARPGVRRQPSARPEEIVMLARWGTFVHRRRWAVLVLSLGLVVLSIAGIVRGVSPRYDGDSTGTEASVADRQLQRLPNQGAPSLTLLYRSASLTARDP